MKVNSAWAIALCTAISFTPARGSFLISDIESWTGPDPGPDVNEAALVIDWNDGQNPLAFGYRWIGTTNKTGQDLLREITSADLRLSIDGIDSGLVSHFSIDFDLDGEAERFRPGWDGVANFWSYYVNNEVFSDPNDFTNNGHILPTNDQVVPTGSPYDDVSPGAWVTSSTGILGRPLVDGSWDGFIYSDGNTPIARPESITAIPEPHSPMLIGLGFLWIAMARRRESLTRITS